MFAIIDVETTGGRPPIDRVTEIAIVIHDGENVIDTYSSLVNPERSIPYQIQNLTGITDAMVAVAPKFYEVAKKIIELTEGCVFVAHNVAFDYKFVQSEFKMLGYAFQRKRLCTVRLGRQLLPGHRSYALGNITRALGIPLTGAHRALNDAMATAHLFDRLLEADDDSVVMSAMLNHGVVATRLPNNITMQQLDDLPESCGVYYFYNDLKEVIYVGKSINIRKRVMEHFANKKSVAARMLHAITDISFEKTGTELLALLLESQEIKQIQPQYNKAQVPKRTTFNLFYYTDEQGYFRFDVASGNLRNVTILASYPTGNTGKSMLRSFQQQYQLCPHLMQSNPSTHSCFMVHLGKCAGACTGAEALSSYNERAQKIIQNFRNDRFEGNDFFLVEPTDEPNELAIVLIQNHIYRGYGTVSREDPPEAWHEAIQPRGHNFDVAQIIKEYMRKGGNMRKVMV